MEFRFTISRLHDGIVMTVDEIEKVLLQQIEETQGMAKQAIWDLAVLYSETGRQQQAADCIGRLDAMAVDDQERVSCGLAMGQLQEQLGDFEAAVRYYAAALELKPEDDNRLYWLHNNLGYSLIQLDRAKEAIAVLEPAVTIGRDRPNAYKNLGLAHTLLGAYAIATAYFVSATQANAADARSLRLLEELIEAHPEVSVDVPDLRAKLAACRDAVAHAAAQQPDLDGHWKKLLDRRGTPN
jgi:tetratricopeptide (TPR) repeat protein